MILIYDARATFKSRDAIDSVGGQCPHRGADLRRHIFIIFSLESMPYERSQRTTRRRSSAGPMPPRRLNGNRHEHGNEHRQGEPRPTFLALRDHGKVYVADMPHLSDGQLSHIGKEAEEVLESLERRILELEEGGVGSGTERDTLIKACTKRHVTRRFIRAIEEEREQRRNNPALRHAAGESLPRTFLEVARHRLPGATFDSLLQEALAACGDQDISSETSTTEAQPTHDSSPTPESATDPSGLPVVVSPDPQVHGTS